MIAVRPLWGLTCTVCGERMDTRGRSALAPNRLDPMPASGIPATTEAACNTWRRVNWPGGFIGAALVEGNAPLRAVFVSRM
jgi:hypothetical protein